MNEHWRNTWVGLTGIIAVAGFCLMLTLFGPLMNLVSHGYPVKAEFADAGGLNIDSRVRLSGVEIGRVSDIELADPPRTGVEVTLQINKNRKLPDNTRAMIYAPAFGGTPWIGLEAPAAKPGAEVHLLPTDGSAVIKGDVSSMMGQLAKQIQDAIQEPMKKFDKLGSQFQQLSDEWVQVGKNVNQLLEPRSVEQVDKGQAEANVTTVLARADAAVKAAKQALEGFNKWVNDPALLADFKQTAANAKDLTGKMSGDVDQLAKRYIAVADDMSATLATLQKTINTARTGDGTIGKLLNDPALYNNLNDTVERMNAAMKEFQLLAEKWKKEGLPVHF